MNHPRAVAAGPRRYAEVIGGREFQIEVARVARDTWRANLVGPHGGPTALMPFYAPTPDEAAALLSRWLTKAHTGTRPGS